MSKRPEHVRCENCVWWEEADEVGHCRRMPPQYVSERHSQYAFSLTVWPTTMPYAWCGEFRDEWPEGRVDRSRRIEDGMLVALSKCSPEMREYMRGASGLSCEWPEEE